jgi:hypothetical protein
VDQVQAESEQVTFTYFKNRTWFFNELQEREEQTIHFSSPRIARWVAVRLQRTIHLLQQFGQDEQSSNLIFSSQSFSFTRRSSLAPPALNK